MINSWLGDISGTRPLSGKAERPAGYVGVTRTWFAVLLLTQELIRHSESNILFRGSMAPELATSLISALLDVCRNGTSINAYSLIEYTFTYEDYEY